MTRPTGAKSQLWTNDDGQDDRGITTRRIACAACPPTLKPPGTPVLHGQSHRPDIEGLRAIAVLLVLAYHGQVGLFAGGFLGVDVFFVISGFLITRSLMLEGQHTGRIGLAEFYARRARRLLPAAALVLVVTAIGVRWLLPVTMWRSFGADIAASAVYVVNWRFAARSVDYLAEDILPSPVLHFWSLAIEEQFYIVWPLLIIAALWMARRRGANPRTVMAWTLGLLVIVPSLTWSMVATAAEPARSFFDTGTRMWELGLGGLTALLTTRPLPIPARAATAIKAIAVATIVGLAMALDETAAWPSWVALGATVPTAVLLALGGRGTDPVERVLSVAPMQRVGAWSYSLYLWHWPPLAILAARWGGLTTSQALAIVALSFIPAVASYRLVENPIRFGTTLRASPGLSLSVGANLSLVAAIAGVAVVISTTLNPAASPFAAQPGSPAAPGAGALPNTDNPDGDPDDPDDAVTNPSLTPADLETLLVGIGPVTPPPALATQDLPRTYPDGCWTRVGNPRPIVCEYGDPDSTVHVALLGDSKAGQWMSALIDIAERNSWRLTNITKSACPLTLAMPDYRGDPAHDCLEWGERVIELLAADPPDIVLASQVASAAWTDDPDASRQDLMVDGMVDAYRRIESNGSRIVLLLDNPHPGLTVYDCVAKHMDDLRPCVFERNDDRGGRTAQLAAAEQGGFAVLDMMDQICPTSPCLPVIGGVLVFRQGSHLTASYVNSMTPVLEDRLRALLHTQPST
jgi:peptidoglycan/LPS O-acetylase OafA/YrhL